MLREMRFFRKAIAKLLSAEDYKQVEDGSMYQVLDLGPIARDISDSSNKVRPLEIPIPAGKMSTRKKREILDINYTSQNERLQNATSIDLTMSRADEI